VFFLVKLCAVSRRVGVVCVPSAAYLIHQNSAVRRDHLQAQFDNVRTLPSAPPRGIFRCPCAEAFARAFVRGA
jgi:hypothetical protein